MSALAFVPAAALTVLSLLLTWRPLPLHPAWSARVLVILSATTALTALATISFVTVVFIAGLFPPEMVWASSRGRLLLEHSSLPTGVGLLAVASLVVSGFLTVRLIYRWWCELRALRRSPSGIGDNDQPMAIAVPGRRGGVLVSKGLLRLLTREQLQVVFRHEHAHLRHRHHVYGSVSAFAASIFPPLAAVHRSVRLALERWADEDAATAIGDRALVARTIAQVALATPRPDAPWHPAVADSHVLQRVEALLGDAPSANPVVGPALLSGTGVATSGMASSAFQLNHIFVLLLL